MLPTGPRLLALLALVPALLPAQDRAEIAPLAVDSSTILSIRLQGGRLTLVPTPGSDVSYSATLRISAHGARNALAGAVVPRDSGRSLIRAFRSGATLRLEEAQPDTTGNTELDVRVAIPAGLRWVTVRLAGEGEIQAQLIGSELQVDAAHASFAGYKVSGPLVISAGGPIDLWLPSAGWRAPISLLSRDKDVRIGVPIGAVTGYSLATTCGSIQMDSVLIPRGPSILTPPVRSAPPRECTPSTTVARAGSRAELGHEYLAAQTEPGGALRLLSARSIRGNILVMAVK